MSSVRSTSMRTLSKFSKQVRQLHMTGPATFPSPLLTSERPAAAAAKKAKDAVSKRPSVEAESDEHPTIVPARHFNTSRELKAVNDTSTIDFAFLPAFDPDNDVTAAHIRVPIFDAFARTTYVEPEDPDVMRPEINTISADSTFISAPSAMSEVHDNGAADIDYDSMAARVMASSINGGRGAGAEQSYTKAIFGGMIEDLFAKPSSSSQSSRA